jgi:hypothetical protein
MMVFCSTNNQAIQPETRTSQMPNSACTTKEEQHLSNFGPASPKTQTLGPAKDSLGAPRPVHIKPLDSCSSFSFSPRQTFIMASDTSMEEQIAELQSKSPILSHIIKRLC